MLPRAKKSFGQNFLVDPTAVRKIIAAADIKTGETVLEIGPGTGVLTRALVDAGARVIAIEADGDLIPALQDEFGERIELIHGNALSLNDSITQRLNDFSYKLVANIPYNITSNVIEQFLTNTPSNSPSVRGRGLVARPSRIVLMVQKEVADRITAQPPKMSLLSVVCQLYAHCERVAVVKAGAFRPIPKVDSAIARLDVYQPKHPSLVKLDPEQVIAIAKRGFASRRKQLKSNLGQSVVSILESLNIDPKARAETLTIEQWIDVSKGISAKVGSRRL